MSAYLVSKAHIDALVCAAISPRGHQLYWHDTDINALPFDDANPDAYFMAVQAHTQHGRREDADRIGAMLWLANLASVAARYPNDTSGDRPGPCHLTDAVIAAYTYRAQTPRLEPVAVLKALDGFEYQACEAADWKASEAHAFCQALRKRAIQQLPGYDEAAWEIDEPCTTR